MSTPLSPRFSGDMSRHVRVLRRAGYTWAEVSMLVQFPVPRCKQLAAEDGPQLFRTVTRVHANGEALIGRVGT